VVVPETIPDLEPSIRMVSGAIFPSSSGCESVRVGMARRAVTTEPGSGKTDVTRGGALRSRGRNRPRPIQTPVRR